jgi:hypothetical protein
VGSSPDEVIDCSFSIYLIVPALVFTQPLTEMITGIFLGCKSRRGYKADILTAIYEPIV